MQQCACSSHSRPASRLCSPASQPSPTHQPELELVLQVSLPSLLRHQAHIESRALPFVTILAIPCSADVVSRGVWEGAVPAGFMPKGVLLGSSRSRAQILPLFQAQRRAEA